MVLLCYRQVASVCYVSGFAVIQAELRTLNLWLAMTAVGQLQSFSLADRIEYAVSKSSRFWYSWCEMKMIELEAPRGFVNLTQWFFIQIVALNIQAISIKVFNEQDPAFPADLKQGERGDPVTI